MSVFYVVLISTLLALTAPFVLRRQNNERDPR